MADTAPESSPGDLGPEAIQCPHCDQVTMPNLLSDGSYICSCTAERALPLLTAQGTPWDGAELTMPAPMDDTSFMPSGPDEHAASPDEPATTTGEKRRKRAPLPGIEARFGRDISTEEYEPLNDARPGEERRDR